MNNLIHYIRHNEVLDENWLLFRFVAWYCASRGIGLPKGRCHFGEIVMFLAPTYIALGLVFKLAFALFLVVKFLTYLAWKPILALVNSFLKRYKRETAKQFANPAVCFGLFLCIPWLVVYPASDGKVNIGLLLASMILPLALGFVVYCLGYWVCDDHRKGIRAFFALGSEAAGALRFRGFGHMAWLVVKSVPKGAVGTVHASGAIASFVHDGWTKMFCKRLTYRFDTSRYEPNYQPTES